ncbi:MAG: hypothetical protein GX539_15695 [Candidatus Cloacimonetes bacterium]|jgi:hypothetical protein|nr:hypothetical protein [Candidatus Cloacimonadota bacterium]
MRRLVLGLVVAGSGLLAACGGGEVVVQAAIRPEGDETAEPTPLPNLEIRALPYDRDAIFDSLRAAYPTPEPEIPDSLARLQDALVEAQEQLAEAEQRWNAARDSLKTLSDRMRQMSRGSAEYVVAFRDFNAQEAIEQQQRRLMDQANQRYSQMLTQFNEQSEAVRARRQAWGDEAFASVNEVIEARLKESGLSEVWDTTDANGVARFQNLKPGDWWIHARYDLPFTELYWNVPVQVERGDPITVILNRENAQVRPKL